MEQKIGPKSGFYKAKNYENHPEAKLVLSDGTVFSGYSFGSEKSVAGEVVFNTGMVGYPESFTDPSYKGQILALTYPMIGNYGVPKKESENNVDMNFESGRIQISGLVVSEYSKNDHHWNSSQTLREWLVENNVPAVFGIDTRELTKKLREKGVMLGKIIVGNKNLEFFDPNRENLVAGAGTDRPVVYGKGVKKVLAIDCGMKNNIIRCFLRRGVKVIRVPWDYDFFANKVDFDGLFISNGPGDPKMCQATIANIKGALEQKIPTFGICLGNQLLGLAAGADTYKLKFGHRSQNQPCQMVGTKRCFITSQNHGFAVNEKTLPNGWEPWFRNANDATNEGIRHKSKPFMSVQFHPEACPGPTDTEFLFDEFLAMLK